MIMSTRFNFQLGPIRDLTPDKGAHAESTAELARPEHIVVGINNRNQDYFDVYRVDIATGRKRIAASQRRVLVIRH